VDDPADDSRLQRSLVERETTIDSPRLSAVPSVRNSVSIHRRTGPSSFLSSEAAAQSRRAPLVSVEKSRKPLRGVVEIEAERESVSSHAERSPPASRQSTWHRYIPPLD